MEQPSGRLKTVAASAGAIIVADGAEATAVEVDGSIAFKMSKIQKFVVVLRRRPKNVQDVK